MMPRASRPLLFALAAGMSTAQACLPADTRPPPAELRLVAAAGDDPAGVVTGDGWTLSIDKLIVGIGDAALERSCEVYSEAHYARLLDGSRPGDQKISTLYGLGNCGFSFRVSRPNESTLLGEGITEEDRARMGATVPIPGEPPPQAGVGVELTATATKNEITKHIAWSFRQATTYVGCRVDATDPAREWKSGDTIVMRVLLSGAAVFASDNVDNAPLAFDPIAAADDTFGNQDGEVTLDEVNAVSMAEAKRYGRYGVGDAMSVRTLRDYLFLRTLGNVARIRQGVVCSVQLGIRETH